jgi:hypothetical protein
LAEETRQSKSATYAKAEHISQKNGPKSLLWSTLLQAASNLVIDAVDSIYLLDCEEATASLDTQTEGDAVYSYKTVSHQTICYFCNQCCLRSY